MRKRPGKRGPYHRWVKGTKKGVKGTYCIHCGVALKRGLSPCKKKG